MTVLHLTIYYVIIALFLAATSWYVSIMIRQRGLQNPYYHNEE